MISLINDVNARTPNSRALVNDIILCCADVDDHQEERGRLSSTDFPCWLTNRCSICAATAATAMRQPATSREGNCEGRSRRTAFRAPPSLINFTYSIF